MVDILVADDDLPRKVTDEDNTVELIGHQADSLNTAVSRFLYPSLHNPLGVFAGAFTDGKEKPKDYESFADYVAFVAGELLALSNHLKSKLPVKVPGFLAGADPAHPALQDVIRKIDDGRLSIDEGRVAVGLKPITPKRKPSAKAKA